MAEQHSEHLSHDARDCDAALMYSVELELTAGGLALDLTKHLDEDTVTELALLRYRQVLLTRVLQRLGEP